MKRVFIRLAVLSVVIGLGLIAIAQAQRAMNRRQHPAEPRPLAVTKASPIPKPINMPASDADGDRPNPFARSAGPPATDPAAVATDRYQRDDAEPPARTRVQVADDIPPADEMLDPGLPPSERGQSRDVPPTARTDPFGLRTGSAPPRRDVVQAQALAPLDDDPARTPPTAEPERLDRLDAGTPAPLDGDRSDFAPPAKGAPRQTEAADIPNEISQDPRALTTDGAAAGATGRPGNRELEGTQTPGLTIEKRAPEEIQVGKPAVFVIKVRNTGAVTAQGVQIHDEVPRGTELVRMKPQATQSPDGKLIWDLGALKPGEEVLVEMELLPIEEGEIGSVATLHFRAEASVRTVATKAVLAVKISAPQKVMIGETATFKIKISNSGSGAATGVVLSEKVPPELKHPAGPELEFDVGTLKPGETRELELTMTAAQAGKVMNVLSARGDANLKAEDRAELEVIAPALKVSMTGPKKRYLERAATYSIAVSNPGTASAQDVELVTTLPKGLKFVEANNAGQYDAATHSVYWSLEELPAQETGNVTLTALPIEAGDQKMQIRSQAKQGLKDEREETVVVEGLAAILFELVDVNDPIEVGGETTYEIRVINQGSKAAGNIQLVAIVPEQMKALAADGPVRYVIDGQRVLFDPLKELAPKADTTYSIKVQGLAAGDQRVQVKLVSDEVETPITKEESTRVYADE